MSASRNGTFDRRTVPSRAGDEVGTAIPVSAPVPAPLSAGRARVALRANAMLEERSDAMRFGVKGPNAADWLQRQGCHVPALPNSWRTIDDAAGSIIARLGSSEFFIEQPRPAVFVTAVASALSIPIDGVYPVLREDRAFELSGFDADAVLAQVCNVDFSQVSRSDRSVVMTMMIGVAVLVIPQDEKWGQSPFPVERSMGTVPSCYRIWCDPSYGDYLWSSLQDVMGGV
jgi:sarcosine oxidase, subunit gamma